MAYLYEKETYLLRGIFFRIYNALGPGLNEKIYQNSICKELTNNKINFNKEKHVNIFYDNEKVGSQKLDLLVDKKIIIEIKSTDRMHSLFASQVIGYLKATKFKLALLVNFGGEKLIIKRFINDSKNSKLLS